jgi:hypothetical protein
MRRTEKSWFCGFSEVSALVPLSSIVLMSKPEQTKPKCNYYSFIANVQLIARLESRQSKVRSLKLKSAI